METRKVKCVLIGDHSVGKTTLMKRLGLSAQNCTLVFDNPYQGSIEFNIIDPSGFQDYPDEAECAIAMFDLTSFPTFLSMKEKLRVFQEMNPNAPVVLCGNKSESPNTYIGISDLAEIGKPFFSMSVKCWSFQELLHPFRVLIDRILTQKI